MGSRRSIKKNSGLAGNSETFRARETSFDLCVIVMAMTKPAHGQGIPECTVQADPSVRLACYDKL